MAVDLQNFLEELRAKISIVDVVGDKVKLTRKGKEHLGLCPFHNEKTPSFTVNEAKGFYHCFGCGAHGDIVKFEMDANNLPFMEAVEKLANKAGVQMPQFHAASQEEIEKKASLYDIMQMAVDFFEKNLRLSVGKEALSYLYNRGFDDELIEKFHLGYAPANNGLKAYLQSKGIELKDMQELGLATNTDEQNQKSYDFFRDRVIIPIFDRKNRPIAFGGRIMGDGQPKYLNSPETPIFNKRRMLYNINNAREFAYNQKELIVCEGYMDVIALDKFGFHNAVAPLGTALTEEQIALAWKLTPMPTLCFDGDNAGIKAATRSVDRVLPILKAGYSLKYIFLPDKMDPDEFLKEKGRGAFEKFLTETTPLIDLLWKKSIEDKPQDTPEQKALIEKCIKEEVGKIADEQIRSYYWQDMKKRIFNAFGARTEAKVYKKPKIARPITNLDDKNAKELIAALMCYPQLIPYYEEKLAGFMVKDEQMKAILDVMLNNIDTESVKSYEDMFALMQNAGFEKELKNMWQIDMIRQQKLNLPEMQKTLDLIMLENQIKTLDMEIKECLRQIETSEVIDETLLEKYEFYKKEKESLLNA